MSYEGFTQILTNKGNNFTQDCWEEWPELPEGEYIVWTNEVDQTNGSEDADESGKRSDGYVELEIDVPSEICDKCGHPTTPNTYKVPPKSVGQHR